MNFNKFYELMDEAQGCFGGYGKLLQDISEWRCFLEFADAYLKNRNVMNPLVVEIGILNNTQKLFYKELLGAEHIGIDIAGNPDILGDSHKQSTIDALKIKLNGRKIDILFIDGDHLYESVKKDYELYSPFVKYIIAFHDIYAKNHSLNLEVSKLWDELIEEELNIPLISFKKNRLPEQGGWAMGIGVMLVGNI